MERFRGILVTWRNVECLHLGPRNVPEVSNCKCPFWHQVEKWMPAAGCREYILTIWSQYTNANNKHSACKFCFWEWLLVYVGNDSITMFHISGMISQFSSNHMNWVWHVHLTKFHKSVGNCLSLPDGSIQHANSASGNDC